MAMNLGSWATRSIATVVVATDGTGDTNDIQEGVNLLPAAGGVVYLKEGTYTITAAIIIPNDNISIIGSGHSSIITTTSNITMISATDVDRIFLDKFYILGDVTQAANIGLYFNDVHGLTCRDLFIEKCGSHGVSGAGGTYNLISGCVVYDCEGDNIHLDGNVVAGGVWTIVESMISTSTLSGIWLDHISQVIISDSEISGNGNYGIFADDSSTINIKGNNILTNIYDGIRLVDYSNSVINGNNLGINDFGSSGTYSGVKLINSSDNNISNNTSWWNDNYGIDISDAGCDDNIVTGNRLRGNTAGGLNDAGTGTEIGHNKET